MPKNKDIGLVIATPREALFMRARDNLKDFIKKLEEDLEVNKEYLKVADRIISEEQKK